MGMTCPMNGCHSTSWCKHKTMMVMMMVVVIGVVLFIALR